MPYKIGKFVLSPLVIVILALIVIAIAVSSAVAFNPGILKGIRERIAGGTQDLAVKLDSIENKYLAEGASEETILVKFKDSVSNERSAKIHQDFGTKVKKKISGINAEVVEITLGDKVGETVEKFKKLDDVEYAEPNYLAQTLLEPNDPLYSSQWNLNKVSASNAWDDAEGGGGPVAVIDTGVSADHPDLKGEVLSGYNFVSENTNTADDHGHGTHVSGIVSASTNNGVGVASVGFKGSILPIKVLDASGSGTYADVASGIIYAANNGARVINLSLGGPSPSTVLQSAVTYAVNKGSFVVAAAGNSGSSTPLYPAACKGALAITATTSSDSLASFSSYGSNAFAAAPGVSITSTYPGSQYKAMSGTSMATPHVSGLMELALAYGASSNKSISGQQLIDFIKNSSDKVGGYAYDANGWNQYFGYGRINAYELISQIKDSFGMTPTPTATVAPSKVASSTVEPPKENTKTNNKISFDVELSAEIDSIDLENQIIKVKIKSISQKMKLSPGDFVDLYMNDDTEIKSQGKSISINDLKIDDDLNVKALWEDDKLTASSIIVQGDSKLNNPASDTPTDTDSSSKTNKGKSKKK